MLELIYTYYPYPKKNVKPLLISGLLVPSMYVLDLHLRTLYNKMMAQLHALGADRPSDDDSFQGK